MPLTSQDILANKAYIRYAAIAFSREAHRLMQTLARVFNFSLDDNSPLPAAVTDTRIHKLTALNNEWTFYMHGSHIHFAHAATGQIVEVKFTAHPDYGCLDGFFFYRFLETTEEFKPLATWFENSDNVYTALDLLVEDGSLLLRKNDRYERLVCGE